MSRGRHRAQRGGKHRALKPKLDRRDLISQSILGLFDGATSLVGLLAALLLSHAQPGAILATAGGLAVAAAIGMAFGVYLSGIPLPGATMLGVATAVGSFLPVIPIAIFPSAIGYTLALLILTAFVVTIAELRDEPRLRAYSLTITTLAVASATAASAAVFLGATG